MGCRSHFEILISVVYEGPCTRMQIIAEEWIADSLLKFPMRIFRGRSTIRPLEMVPDTRLLKPK